MDLQRYVARPIVHPDGALAHAIWRLALREQLRLLDDLRDSIAPEYLDGFSRLELAADRLPSLDEINLTLSPIGWAATCVDGYISPKVYAGLVAEKIFPVAGAVRPLEHLDHAPGPDLIHDVFGHLPMLFSRPYREHLERFARVMASATESPLDTALCEAHRALAALSADPGGSTGAKEASLRARAIQEQLSLSPSELTHLGRMFLWSIEFGLMGTAEDYKLFGAGLLSSRREARRLSKQRVPVLDYSLDVIEHDVDFTGLQSRYYVARGYEQLAEVLECYVQMHAGERRRSC